MRVLRDFNAVFPEKSIPLRWSHWVAGKRRELYLAD